MNPLRKKTGLYIIRPRPDQVDGLEQTFGKIHARTTLGSSLMKAIPLQNPTH